MRNSLACLWQHWGKMLLAVLFLIVAWGIWWLVPAAPRITLDGSTAAFSADGRTVVTRTDAPIQLWDTATGTRRASFAANEKYLGWVTFSPDGKLVLTLDGDGTLKLWDPVTGQNHGIMRTDNRFFNLLNLGGRARPVAFSPDGGTLAFVTPDNKSIVLWDIAAAKERARCSGGLAFAFSPDGRAIAAAVAEGSADKSIPLVKLYDVATGREVAALKGHARPITAVAFSADGKLLASACDGPGPGGGPNWEKPCEVKIWDVAKCQEQAGMSISPPTQRVLSLSFEAGGRILYLRLGDLMVTWSVLWDIRTLPPKQLPIETYGVAFSPDGQFLAFSNEGELLGAAWGAMFGGKPVPTGEEALGRITVWQTSTMEPLVTFRPYWVPRDCPRVFGFAGQTLIVSGTWLRENAGFIHTARRFVQGRTGENDILEGEAIAFDAATGRELGTIDDPRTITISPDGRTIAIKRNNQIQLFDVPPRKPWLLVLALWAGAALPFVGLAYCYRKLRCLVTKTNQ